jgi:hypothetical protein
MLILVTFFQFLLFLKLTYHEMKKLSPKCSKMIQIACTFSNNYFPGHPRIPIGCKLRPHAARGGTEKKTGRNGDRGVGEGGNLEGKETRGLVEEGQGVMGTALLCPGARLPVNPALHSPRFFSSHSVVKRTFHYCLQPVIESSH